jgi:hypothetical protein
MSQGERVNNLEELAALADQRRSVVCHGYGAWNRPKPAAFMISLHGRDLLLLFRSGMFAWVKDGPKKANPEPWKRRTK